MTFAPLFLCLADISSPFLTCFRVFRRLGDFCFPFPLAVRVVTVRVRYITGLPVRVRDHYTRLPCVRYISQVCHAVRVPYTAVRVRCIYRASYRTSAVRVHHVAGLGGTPRRQLFHVGI